MKHRRTFGKGAAIVASVSATGLAWAQRPVGPDTYGYHQHMMWGGGWFGMILGPLFLLLLLVAVVAGLAFMGRWFGGQQHHVLPAPRREPIDILRERFARGEIDKEEFEERRRVLGE